MKKGEVLVTSPLLLDWCNYRQEGRMLWNPINSYELMLMHKIHVILYLCWKNLQGYHVLNFGETYHNVVYLYFMSVKYKYVGKLLIQLKHLPGRAD